MGGINLGIQPNRFPINHSAMFAGVTGAPAYDLALIPGRLG